MPAYGDRKASLLIYKLLQKHVNKSTGKLKVLDVGCRSGKLVQALRGKNIDAYGCDIEILGGTNHYIRQLDLENYCFPFPDKFFDAVISLSVLEHVFNKDEFFKETKRVLVEGGKAIHIYPSKTYLLLEPHTDIPFASWLHPNVPDWYIFLWTSLGFGSTSLRKETRQKTAQSIIMYLKNDLCYWSNEKIRKESNNLFRETVWLMNDYIEFAQGGFGRLFRKLRMRSVGAIVSRKFRMAVLCSKK